jgi:hypothetical protein
MMSISPQAGQLTWSMLVPSVQNAGHEPFPVGIWARISIRPWVQLALPLVQLAGGHGGLFDCLLKELVPPARLATLGRYAPAAGERIAQLVAFGLDAAAVARVARPRFAWPWPERPPPPGGKGAICRYGRMGGGFDVLNPHEAPPCARGLRCCYPCGIQGCNSVCMSWCLMSLP